MDTRRTEDTKTEDTEALTEAWLQEERARFHAAYIAPHPMVAPGQIASNGTTTAFTVHYQQPVYFRRELPPKDAFTNEEWSALRRRSLALVLRHVADWLEDNRAFDAEEMWLSSDATEIGVGLLVDR